MNHSRSGSLSQRLGTFIFGRGVGAGSGLACRLPASACSFDVGLALEVLLIVLAGAEARAERGAIAGDATQPPRHFRPRGIRRRAIADYYSFIETKLKRDR